MRTKVTVKEIAGKPTEFRDKWHVPVLVACADADDYWTNLVFDSREEAENIQIGNISIRES